MNIRKKIVCLRCGETFSVDRGEYENRLVSSLCDTCLKADAEPDDTNLVSEIADLFDRATKFAARTVKDLMQNRGKDNFDKENYDE